MHNLDRRPRAGAVLGLHHEERGVGCAGLGRGGAGETAQRRCRAWHHIERDSPQRANLSIQMEGAGEDAHRGGEEEDVGLDGGDIDQPIQGTPLLHI